MSLLLAATLTPQTRAQEETTLQQAESRFKRGDFASAVNLLDGFPAPQRDANWNYLRGVLYFQYGKVGRAVELLEKAAQAKSRDSDVFMWLGRARGKQAEKAFALKAPFLAGKARDALQKAVELNPGNLDARDDLLDYYLNAPGFLGGGTDKARALAAQIKDTHPSKYHLQMAAIYSEHKEFKQALEETQAALKVNPERFGNYTALAELYQKMGETQRARKVLENLPQRFSRQARAHFELGRFDVESGHDLDQGRLQLEEYLKAYSGGEPYPFEAHYWLGKAFLEMDQPSRALSQFQAALQLFPAHRPSLQGLAQAGRRVQEMKTNQEP